MNILFVCSRNRIRSLTAQKIYARQLVVLDIPDEYQAIDDELIEEISARVQPFLESYSAS